MVSKDLIFVGASIRIWFWVTNNHIYVRVYPLHRHTTLASYMFKVVHIDLHKDNFRELYGIICDYWWNEEMDIPEFHNAKLSILFKKGDTKEINNHWGICLLNVCSKIISALIGSRLQETPRKHGCDEQNGFLNKKGCIDGSFCLRNCLHARKSIGHETWVLFIALVIAFDTVNRKLLFQIQK